MPKVADWFHIERVYKNALLIAKEEVCETIVKLALLHDIADSKFNNGDEVGRKQRGLLESEDVDGEIINHVIKIENISYKGGNFEKSFASGS
jgi:uncharacterized protein